MADATKSIVYCLGITCEASSAIPSAASPYALCACASLKKTSAICVQASLFGMFWLGHRTLNIADMASKSGIFHFSFETFAVSGGGCNFLAMSLRYVNSLLVIVFKIIFMSADLARFQMGVSADLYDVRSVS